MIPEVAKAARATTKIQNKEPGKYDDDANV